jgi:LysM repeat protein
MIECVRVFIVRYPEVLPLAVNLAMTASGIYTRQAGKTLYWLGASILTVGILKMRG